MTLNARAVHVAGLLTLALGLAACSESPSAPSRLRDQEPAAPTTAATVISNNAGVLFSETFSDCTNNGNFFQPSLLVGGGVRVSLWLNAPSCPGWTTSGPVFFATIADNNGSALTAVGDTAIWLNEEGAAIETTVSGLTLGAGYRLDLLLWNDDQPFDTGLDITVGTNPTVNFSLPAGSSGGPRIESFCFLAPSASPVVTLKEGGNTSASPVISSLTISEQADITSCSAEASVVTVTAANKTVTYGLPAPSFTYTLTDEDEGSWTPPSGWTAPSCTSDPAYTTSTAAGTAIKIQCSDASASGVEFEYVDGTLTVETAQPALTWTGTSGLVTGGSLTLSASLSIEACIGQGEVTYEVDGVPASSPYPVPADGGIFEVVAIYGGNNNCEATSVSEIVVVAVAGSTTTGGGIYRVFNGGSQRIHFGHTVQRMETTNRRAGTTTTAYRGQLLWMVTEQWRFKGTVYSSSTNGIGDDPAFVTFPCPASSPAVGTSGSDPRCGVIFGTGVLQSWNGATQMWESVGGVRGFTATIYDGGLVRTCRGRSNCTEALQTDFFGLSLEGTVPDGVPLSSPEPLQRSQNGNIVIR